MSPDHRADQRSVLSPLFNTSPADFDAHGSLSGWLPPRDIFEGPVSATARLILTAGGRPYAPACALIAG